MPPRPPTSPLFPYTTLFRSPPHAAMLLHVTVSDAVRHALVAECIDQPIEDGWRIVTAHRGDDPLARQANSAVRSEEHTSELQSRRDLVCRLLLEKKKKKI